MKITGFLKYVSGLNNPILNTTPNTDNYILLAGGGHNKLYDDNGNLVNSKNIISDGYITSAKGFNSGTMQQMLASYYFPGTTTGTIKITLPNGFIKSMNIYEINLYEYFLGDGGSKIIIGGCNYFFSDSSSDKHWVNNSYSILGNYSKGVRLAYDGSNCCILLGTVTSTWYYPQVHLVGVYAGYYNKDKWKTGYSISLITDESPISLIVKPPLTKSTALGFYKEGSSDSYLLLGGGGHKAISDFALASDYLKLSGGTLTGPLVVNNPAATSLSNSFYSPQNIYNLVLNGDAAYGTSGIYFSSTKGTTKNNYPSDGAFLQYQSASAGSISGEKGALILGITNDPEDSLYLNTCSSSIYHRKGLPESYTDYKIWTEGNDGEGSGLDADTLDGNHYQNILERTHSGQSASGTSTGWFRIAKTNVHTTHGINFILAISRTYHYVNNESYQFSISINYNSVPSITQLSGYANDRLITKIRVTSNDANRISYIDLYIDKQSTTNSYSWYTVGNATSYTTWEANPEALTYNAEFNTVNGCSSNYGFTGNLTGLASSATNLSGTTANSIPYQTGTSTAYISPSTAGYVLSSNGTTSAPSWKNITDYFTSNNAMVYKGNVSSISGLSQTAQVGWTYRVSTAFTSTTSGTDVGSVEVGDIIVCLTAGVAASGSTAAVVPTWTVMQNNIDGAVIGPGSSVNNNIPIFSDTTGKVIKDSGKSLNDYLDWGGDDTKLGSGSPAEIAKTYFNSTHIPKSIKLYYNSSGNEATLFFSKSSASDNYGTILKWGYFDRYLRILRNNSGTWQSTDWEKIYAGYADSASYSDSAGSADLLATERTLTIGSKGKTFDGSADVSWSLSDIGAAEAIHTHSYLPLSGGRISGKLIISAGSDSKLIFNNTDNETKYQQIEFQQNGTAYGFLGTYGNDYLQWNFNPIYHAGNKNIGTTAGTYCDGADSRLSNARTPTAHTHGLLNSDFTVTVPNGTTDNSWSIINSSYNGFLLKSIRCEAGCPSWSSGNYSASIIFGGSDTKGIVSCAFDTPKITFSGGNGTKPLWNLSITGTTGTSYDLSKFSVSDHTHKWSDITSKPWNWSDKEGQPTWLWGGDAINEYYVYNPSNFNVATAVTSTAISCVFGNSISNNPSQAYSNNRVKFYSRIIKVIVDNVSYAGNTTGFPAINNANAILSIGRHPESDSYIYQSQFGFSSNGNLYYRNCSTVPDITDSANAKGATWGLVYTSKNLTDNNQLSNGAGYLTTHQSLTGCASAYDTTNRAAKNVDVQQDSTSASTYPLLWTVQNNNTSHESSLVYKSHDKLTWQPSTGTLRATTFSGNLSGNATTSTSASKLTNTSAIGSATKPVYFSADGIPVACTNSLNATVPSDAVFTDTTYDVATASALGLLKASAVRTSEITTTQGGITANRYYGIELDSTGKAFVNVPWTDTNTDTHYTSKLVVGTSTSTGNTATSNGSTSLNIYENSLIRSTNLIVGTGATTVVSDATGKITINSTDTNTTYGEASSTSLGLVKVNESGNPFGLVPKVRTDGVMEVGKFLDFHSSASDTSDYSTRLVCQGAYSNTVNLPTTSGTLMLKDDTAAKITLNYNESSDYDFPVVWGNSITSSTESASLFKSPSKLLVNPSTGVLKATKIVTSSDITSSAFYQASDIRYKTIKDNINITCKDIAELPIFDFTWKDSFILRSGTSALEVQKVLPYIVTGKNILTVDYGVLGSIIGILASREILEMKLTIIELTNRIKELENE